MLVVRGDVGSVARKVSDMTDRRLDYIVLTKKLGDGISFSRRFNDD